jgi:hypothetical protein
MHCDDFLPSLPGPSLLSSALGCCCLRRTGALPLTPTRGAAPGPRLGPRPKNPSPSYLPAAESEWICLATVSLPPIAASPQA